MATATRLLLVAFLSAVALSSPSPRPIRAEQGQNEVATARELRIRKLHLVRPDLIHYPLAYEVYC